ncbi:7,8-dihydro-8-oxoguanine-triphosphatase [Shewanella sp. NFH-SH190041]|uniref:8-oxo-dGTP diphosphatase MutT n=1 Tax=Shewanella sp. NFH-SH190041 TaxID=2950245 RepID=UPI0021C34481|nr:8-oxo-dGTP diphosphatase MutT [Shewanella sp. NFH-SH190041]BDM65908.1 7,8-dihydro-8-oxoguanine-triphosphatase [Shewanella sp. NFH-SH190041]
MSKRIHVAVGVILGVNNTILLAKRPQHLHQGGKWEFPGGKVEPGESVEQALSRELKEEVAITVNTTEPFMTISFDYPDKQVLLDIHKVTKFSGSPLGVEGQELQWVSKTELQHYEFPEANQPIIHKLQQETA